MERKVVIAASEKNRIEIPSLITDGSLLSRLLPIVMAGFDQALDKESKLYIRLLSRLIDKAFNEYMNARMYLLEEIKSEDKLKFRFAIIDHLENCINALGRVGKILRLLTIGIETREKSFSDKAVIKELKLTELINRSVLIALARRNVSAIRNRIEHIDEDIYLDKFYQGIFLDIDRNYKKICINNNCISLHQLSDIIGSYHKLVLGIFRKLPNRAQDGKYYYDKR